jgi:hypothetical protein
MLKIRQQNSGQKQTFLKTAKTRSRIFDFIEIWELCNSYPC